MGIQINFIWPVFQTKFAFGFRSKFILQLLDWSAKFILQLLDWSAKFILQLFDWSAKFILRRPIFLETRPIVINLKFAEIVAIKRYKRSSKHRLTMIQPFH